MVALGKGSDSDIITAAVKALINGLNNIEAKKRNPAILGKDSTDLGLEKSRKKETLIDLS